MSKSKTMAAAVSPAAVKKSEVVAQGGAGLPAYLDEVKMTGAGVSNASEDNLIPMAMILQKMSQAVDKTSQNHVAGAEPGMIYVKALSHPLVDGDKGFLFQPCYFHKGWVEWMPIGSGGGGGNGFVGSHTELPPEAVKEEDPKTGREVWKNKKAGSEYVETRYHVGFMIDETGANPPTPLVIPFASTGHTVSRGWTFLMNQKMVGPNKADSWAVYYRLTTRLKAKNNNSWFMYEVRDAGPEDASGLPTTHWVPSLADYQRGKALYESLASGARQFEQGTGDDAAAATKPDTM